MPEIRQEVQEPTVSGELGKAEKDFDDFVRRA
jgi:hypothetical protein